MGAWPSQRRVTAQYMMLTSMLYTQVKGETLMERIEYSQFSRESCSLVLAVCTVLVTLKFYLKADIQDYSLSKFK